jgi:hypothetical protein
VIIHGLEEQSIECRAEDLIKPEWVFEDSNDQKILKAICSPNASILALKLGDKSMKYFLANNPTLNEKFLEQFRLEDCVAKFGYSLDVNLSNVD